MRRLLLATLLAAAALPAAASASTVSVSTSHFAGDEHDEPNTTAAVTWTAAPGEANRLTVTALPDRIVVHDHGAPLTLGAGCTPLGDGGALCLTTLRIDHVALRADAGDGNDTIAFDGTVPSAYSTIDAGPGDDHVTLGLHGLTTVDGGPGDDVLRGGPGSDTLLGGTGADVISGGDGDDSITGDPAAGPYSRDVLDGGANDPSHVRVGWGDHLEYSGRPGPVRVDLAAGVGGAPGEDDVVHHFERVDGGNAPDDVLLGDDHDNYLDDFGPDGPKPAGGVRIEGRGGNDTLIGGGKGAPSTLLAGPGNDRLGLWGPGVAEGGSGDDQVSLSGPGVADGGPGDDELSLSTNPRTTIRCGGGVDDVEMTEHGAALLPRDCEQASEGTVTLSHLRLAPHRLTLDVALASSDYEDYCTIVTVQNGGQRYRLLTHQIRRLNGVTPAHFVVPVPEGLPSSILITLGDIRCSYFGHTIEADSETIERGTVRYVVRGPGS